MATRSIITHQPEVSCALCGRRLLRGERPDVFLHAGDERTVCELCTPRAADEGWLRASGAVVEPSVPAPRARRGRSILERLRQRREAVAPTAVSSAALEGDAVARRRRRRSAWEHDLEDAWEPQPAAGQRPAVAEADPVALLFEQPVAGKSQPATGGASAVAAGSPIALAVEIFNASECAARVAGISRALGDPSVVVRVAGEDRVTVVVAWELCWYRYEVDLSQTPATIGLIADGSELDELEPADRLPNATANERGELRLLA